MLLYMPMFLQAQMVSSLIVIPSSSMAQATKKAQVLINYFNIQCSFAKQTKEKTTSQAVIE